MKNIDLDMKIVGIIILVILLVVIITSFLPYKPAAAETLHNSYPYCHIVAIVRSYTFGTHIFGTCYYGYIWYTRMSYQNSLVWRVGDFVTIEGLPNQYFVMPNARISGIGMRYKY